MIAAHRFHRSGPFWALALGATLMAAGGSGFTQERQGLLEDEANTVHVVRQSGPSVVAVHVTVENAQAHPLGEPGEHEGAGSGFVVDAQGRIATNFHVVVPALAEASLETRAGASITVSFLQRPGEEYPVRVTGVNADFDLALLEFIDPQSAPRAPPLPLGDSDQVEAGQKAIAIGAPFGLHSTVTTGIVSAIEREQPGLVGIEIPFIQTDAAVNPGNSGGPLLNSRGEVIGINNAILASPAGPGFMGVGFAVPINLLRQSMEELVAGGFSGVAAAIAELPDRPRLGITAPLTVDHYPKPLRDELNLPGHGVIVAEVSSGGPADRAGLQGSTEAVLLEGRPFPIGGDIIMAAEGQDVRRTIDLQRIILEKEAGDTVDLTVWRDGETRKVSVTLEVVAPD
jgi:serine protease Do